ncbi:MAG: hypothetical protein JW702_09865 [Clostridiales bacterium]|nr:hypothetical protein [Clostridiales bacterium]
MKKVLIALMYIFIFNIALYITFADNYCNFNDQPVEKIVASETNGNLLRVYRLNDNFEDVIKSHESNFEEALFMNASKSFEKIEGIVQGNNLVSFLREKNILNASYIKLVANKEEYFYYIKNKNAIYYLDAMTLELNLFSTIVENHRNENFLALSSGVLSILVITYIYDRKKRVKY